MALQDAAHTAAEAGTQGAGHGESSGQVLIEHITNSRVWHFFKDVEIHLPQFHLFGLDLSITLHVLMMWIAGLLVVGLFWRMAVNMRRQKARIPRGAFVLLEMMVLFVRDEIAVKTMGEKLGRKMAPLILTFFFFILFCNLLGLVPFMATATGNINVTAALAVIAFFTVQGQGIRSNGFGGYVRSFIPSGVPVLLVAIIFPIEILSQFTRHFALCMRLFANMIAGHVVVLALITLIFIFGTVLVSPISIGLSVFIYLLEILVDFIQAYVFTMLAALFIGMAAHPEH